ncbi:SpoIIIAH-like family protein [Desulfosporosinus sp.]|uniref:SpoIIIAH-like family protein n=1 Tax=Desulfosporosinus sp. TaxID=157907 RepID=UPI000E97E328|nr:SpoIIIAH-like family protein [Desulfosporosinus sp.]MBC2726867.1 SpoIIIAH-like family protein [Desulfosporosinus sp.]HBV89057.1 SpoIIIAH-like family protein [Desulfosporosinus sp.]
MLKHISRPILLLVGHKSKLWIIGIIGLVALMGIIGVRFITYEPHAYLSRQASLPVNAQVVDPSIQFEVETVKPNDAGGDYFVNYRLKREQLRQEAKAMLSKLLDSTVEKSKAQAQEKWLELSSKIQREEEIENLLKLKGFEDAVADVFPEHVTVIVYAPTLTPHERDLIQEIVVRVTNVSLDKITISSKK